MKLLRKIVSDKNTPLPLKFWRDLYTPKLKKMKGSDNLEPRIRNMRGNPEARVVIIAPPCTPFEYKEGLPMCDPQALVFHDILKETIDFDTNKDALVVSCSRHGLKPSKYSTEGVRQWLEQCLQINAFDVVICVGELAFAHIFGRGKKMAMSSIAGNVMYLVETHHKPLFVFPGFDGLLVELTGVRHTDNRIIEWHEKVTNNFRKFARKLKELRILP